MTHSEISAFPGEFLKDFLGEFLRSGALIRLSTGKVRLWKGPFKAIQSEKTKVFSVGYMEFFGSHVHLLESPSPVLEIEVSELRRQLQSWIEAEGEIQGRPQPFNSAFFQPPSLTRFQQSFQAILGKIHRGEIEKAVPVVFSESSHRPSPTDMARCLFHALEAKTELNVFGFWNEHQGILGATPEILFHVKDNVLKTMALAGTCPKDEASSRTHLLRDPKEMKEHRLVVEDIQKRLEKLGWVKTGETVVLELPTLFHLQTPIEVEISQSSHNSCADLMKLLHPTAALGVFPRNFGLQWLQTLPDQADRGLFGAPIAFSLSHTEYIALVAIRCLQWNEQGSRVGSGCGLVESSDLHREWKELAAKRDSVFQILGLRS